MGIPRGGEDVDWAAVTRASVATATTLPPPISVDPLKLIKDHQAQQARKAAAGIATDRIDYIPPVPSES